MSDIRMTTEMRTDYDCETTGMPAERWGEAVFTVAVMAGEDAVWKGTLEGLRRLLQGGLAT
jgi:hypothetical protein